MKSDINERNANVIEAVTDVLELLRKDFFFDGQPSPVQRNLIRKLFDISLAANQDVVTNTNDLKDSLKEVKLRAVFGWDAQSIKGVK